MNHFFYAASVHPLVKLFCFTVFWTELCRIALFGRRLVAVNLVCFCLLGFGVHVCLFVCSLLLRYAAVAVLAFLVVVNVVVVCC